MTTATPIETNEYRILLVGPELRGLYALDRGDEYRLIRVVIPQRTRVARELQKALYDVWGLAVLILDIQTTADDMSPCAIAELLQGTPPVEFRKIQPDQLPSFELSEDDRSSLYAVLAGDAKSPFGGVGWIDEAIAWAEIATGGRVSSKFGVEQYNAGGEFTLVRLRMERGCDYWLKATGEPNTHEGRITSLLSKLCRGYVPEVVAEHPAWNAWLMRNDADSMSTMPCDVFGITRLLEGAAESLAELQMRTVGAELDLFEAGAFDHRTSVLRTESETLFAYIDEAMRLQTSTKAERIETKRLCELRSLFEDACDYIDSLGLHDTVLHGDMNLGNILFAGRLTSVAREASRSISGRQRDHAGRQRSYRPQSDALQTKIDIARTGDDLQWNPTIPYIGRREGDRNGADRACGIACTKRAASNRPDAVLLLATEGLRNRNTRDRLRRRRRQQNRLHRTAAADSGPREIRHLGPAHLRQHQRCRCQEQNSEKRIDNTGKRVNLLHIQNIQSSNAILVRTQTTTNCACFLNQQECPLPNDSNQRA